MLVRKYVRALSNEQKVRIIEDYDEFEKTGVTGDTYLRNFTESLIEFSGATSVSMFGTWAQMLAFECHRYFSIQFLRYAPENKVLLSTEVEWEA